MTPQGSWRRCARSGCSRTETIVAEPAAGAWRTGHRRFTWRGPLRADRAAMGMIPSGAARRSGPGPRASPGSMLNEPASPAHGRSTEGRAGLRSRLPSGRPPRSGCPRRRWSTTSPDGKDGRITSSSRRWSGGWRWHQGRRDGSRRGHSTGRAPGIVVRRGRFSALRAFGSEAVLIHLVRALTRTRDTSSRRTPCRRTPSRETAVWRVISVIPPRSPGTSRALWPQPLFRSRLAPPVGRLGRLGRFLKHRGRGGAGTSRSAVPQRA
jgi:hypothetical protein